MQFQKSSSHTLASRLNRYTVVGTAALSMGLLLYGCGENRIAQCNKFARRCIMKYEFKQER